MCLNSTLFTFNSTHRARMVGDLILKRVENELKEIRLKLAF